MTPAEFTNVVRQEVLARKNFNKIFCIGYNKTGTTTLETALRLYGYNLPNQQEQEVRLTEQCFSTDYTALLSFVNGYDAFQDMPFSQGLTYVVADALFPNSKFILTERDSESWFKSMTSFHKKIFNVDDMSKVTEADLLEKHTYLYRGYLHTINARMLTTYQDSSKKVNWDKLFDKDYYIKLYEERNHTIKKYFADAPDKLLVIDVIKENSTKNICDFLNIPHQYIISMPHANQT